MADCDYCYCAPRIPRQVWVVEEFSIRNPGDPGQWEPTGEMSYSHNAALALLEIMRNDFPGDTHRLARYVGETIGG